MMPTKNILALAALLGLTMTSCLEEPNVDPTTPSQLFRPITFTGNVDVVTVSFNWTPIKDASYLLEISRDSFQFERDLQSIPIDLQAKYVLEDLRSQSRYSARIKAVSKNPAVKDSDYQMILFTTGLENIFYQVDTALVTSTVIDLLWEPEKVATYLEVTPAGGVSEKITLTPEQLLAGNILLENLQPATLYTFRIYNGEILRGTITAQTKPVPASGS